MFLFFNELKDRAMSFTLAQFFGASKLCLHISAVQEPGKNVLESPKYVIFRFRREVESELRYLSFQLKSLLRWHGHGFIRQHKMSAKL